jgi:hypothetical protein
VTGKHRLTEAYVWFLAGWAKRLSWSEVAHAFHTTWDCSGLIEPDTLIRDNIYQLLRCRNGTKTNEQTVF